LGIGKTLQRAFNAFSSCKYYGSLAYSVFSTPIVEIEKPFQQAIFVGFKQQYVASCLTLRCNISYIGNKNIAYWYE
jgi:hypothetical protein